MGDLREGSFELRVRQFSIPGVLAEFVGCYACGILLCFFTSLTSSLHLSLFLSPSLSPSFAAGPYFVSWRIGLLL